MKKSLFAVVYEDKNIVVVNKASGIAVSPDRWDLAKERLDKLVAESLNLQNIFIVHRIDRETSGLVIFAKNSGSHKSLSLAFEERQVKKRYIVVVNGRPSWNETVCTLPLVPNGNKQHHTIIDKFRGKESVTNFRLLGSAGNYSVLEALPETGRTHQIRVHLKALEHPVVCDELYGNNKPVLLSSFKRSWRGDPHEERPLISRLGLHAAELFVPGYSAEQSGEEKEKGLNLKAPLSRDITALIHQMEKVSGLDFAL